MNSKDDQRGKNSSRQIHATTFGVYDPGTLGISFHNMQAMVQAATENEDRLYNWLMETENAHLPKNKQYHSGYVLRDEVAVGKTQLHITSAEIGKFNKMMKDHQEKFEFYYRIRVHEKNHWFTNISSILPIARFFSNQDANHFLWSALQAYSGGVYLPLYRWMQRSDCPKELSDKLLLYHIKRIVDMAVDGDLPAQQDWHILSAYYPELTSVDRFWEKPFYKIGYRALIEGAGKASEWLYSLHKNPSDKDRAWRDIQNSPPIYRMALDRLVEVMPSYSLLEYLQLLSVLVEFAINPFIIHDQQWPFLFGKEGPAADMLPGFRFQRLLDLLGEKSDFDPGSKQSISDYLIKATKRAYGWNSPAEATIRLLELLGKAKATMPDEAKFWNPLETIRMALKVKTTDPFAYVAPINAHLINVSNTYPQVMITSPGFNVGDESASYTYLFMWYQSALLESIVYNEQDYCPCSDNEWFAHMVAMMKNCSQNTLDADNNLLSHPKVKSLKNCNLFKTYMTAQFGDILKRMHYLEMEEK